MKKITYVSDVRLNWGTFQKKFITLKDGELYEESEWVDIVDEKEQYASNNSGDSNV